MPLPFRQPSCGLRSHFETVLKEGKTSWGQRDGVVSKLRKLSPAAVASPRRVRPSADTATRTGRLSRAFDIRVESLKTEILKN